MASDTSPSTPRPSGETTSPNTQISLPDDWSATDPKPQEKWCSTCEWDGSWSNLLYRTPGGAWESHKYWRHNVPRSGWDTLVNAKFTNRELEKSAATGNLCCTVLLSILRHTQHALGFSDSGISLRCSNNYISTVSIFDDVLRAFAWKVFIPSKNPSDGMLDCLARTPPSMSTSSVQALNWANNQIHQCLKSHPRCQDSQAKEPFIPTRLVSIAPGPDNRVMLRCRNEVPPTARYAALSHCWGDEAKWPACRLTSNNYKEHLASIPWDTLPKTFQEATTFARGLGLGYIWIDSLCIIQNDETDWRAESGSMCDVYSNSYVTLAALVSQDSSEGLFRHQDSRNILNICTLTYRGSKHQLQAARMPTLMHTRFPCRLPFPGFRQWEPGFFVGRKPFPLLTRAWAFQERLVAPRLIFFGEQELLWECFEGTTCECNSHFEFKGSQFYQSLKTSYGKTLHQRGTHPSLWHHLVSEYGSLCLTKRSDRLPAIAAIAEQLSRLNPEEKYLCGLWQSSIHLDLLWTVTQRSAVRQGESLLQSAPSWSWASVGENVIFTGTEEVLSDIDFELLDSTIDYAGKSSFGQVNRGLITLRGVALNCLWEVSVGDIEGLSDMNEQRLVLPGTNCVVKFCPDYMFQSNDMMDGISIGEFIPILVLYVSVAYGNCCGLVLHQRVSNGPYHRLGFFMENEKGGKSMRPFGGIQTCVIE